MKTVAIVGWRGMVGSVLMQRLKEENDFAKFEPLFCSTSQVGQNGPEIGGKVYKLADGNDEKVLAQADIVVSCQGGDYTKALHPKLRALGWQGYWIDAASTLRMEPNAVIVLDPVNRHVIDRALENGIKDFIDDDTLRNFSYLFQVQCGNGALTVCTFAMTRLANPAVAAFVRELAESPQWPSTEKMMQVVDFKDFVKKETAKGPRPEDVMNHFWELDNKLVEDTLFWEETGLDLSKIR